MNQIVRQATKMQRHRELTPRGHKLRESSQQHLSVMDKSQKGAQSNVAQISSEMVGEEVKESLIQASEH